MNGVEPFSVRDCALLSMATGKRAQNLRELRDQIVSIEPASIYYHFWARLLRPAFDDPEYQNDFASWAYHGLRDARLAERLSIIDPSGYADLEDLCQALIELIEERLEETEIVPWARAGQEFHFMRSQLVVFDTNVRIETRERLQEIIPQLSLGSVFYHFIDARRRTPDRKDDFSQWLLRFGDAFSELAACLSTIDPYFSSLRELRDEIAATFGSCPLREVRP